MSSTGMDMVRRPDERSASSPRNEAAPVGTRLPGGPARGMTPARLPVQDDAVLVPDDLCQMARIDEQVVPWARFHHGAVRHRVTDTA